MTLTPFTVQVNALLASLGQDTLTRAGIAYRIIVLGNRGLLPDGITMDSLRPNNAAGQPVWDIPRAQADALAAVVGEFQIMPYNERKNIGKRGKKL